MKQSLDNLDKAIIEEFSSSEKRKEYLESILLQYNKDNHEDILINSLKLIIDSYSINKEVSPLLDIEHKLFSLKNSQDWNYKLTIMGIFSPIFAMNLAGMVYDLCKKYPYIRLDIGCEINSPLLIQEKKLILQ